MNMLKSKLAKVREQAKNNKGFTLVELIVVIVILAILIGVSVNGYTKYIGQSRLNTDKQNVATIKSIAMNATAENGVYEEFINDTSHTPLTITLTTTAAPVVDGGATGGVYKAAVIKALAGSTTKLQYQNKETTPQVVITVTPDAAGDVTVTVTPTGYPDNTF